jgi:predicted DNA-binding WGR domain protein
MSFICRQCKDLMCDDCRSISEEYEQLLTNYKRENAEGSARVKQLERELESANRRSAMWEEQAKLGYPDVVKAWIDAQVKERIGKGVSI